MMTGANIKLPHIQFVGSDAVQWGQIAGNISNQQDLTDFISDSVSDIIIGIITDIDGRISAIVSDISTINGNITDLGNQIAGNTASITGLSSDLSSLTARVVHTENQIASLNTSVSAIQTTIPEIQTNLTNAVSRVSSLEDAVASINSEISTINSTLTAVNGKITGIESDISGINTDISSIKGDISAIDGRLTASETKLATVAEGANVNVQPDWEQADDTKDDFIKNKPYIPTKTSDLTNDSNFVADATYVKTDNNFTNAEKTKLSGVAPGAEVNVQSDWDQTSTTSDDYIKNKPDFTALENRVETNETDIADLNTDITGVKGRVSTNETDIAAIENKLNTVETGAEVNVQSDWNQTNTSEDDYIKNKPAIPTKTSDLTNDAVFLRNILSGSNVTVSRTPGSDSATISVAGINLPDRYVSSESVNGIIGDPFTGMLLSVLTGVNTSAQPVASDNVIFANGVLGEITAINGSTYDGVIIEVPISASWGTINGLIANQADLIDLLDDKVDREAGKGLSTNDYTTAEKTKLAGVAAGAEVNVQPDWNQTNTASDDYIKNKPAIPTKTSDLDNDRNFVEDATYVKTDNNYTNAEKTKLSGVAAGAEVNVQADWNQTNTSNDSYIRNKPDIAALTGRVTASETAITNLGIKNDATNTNVTNLTGRVAANETAITGLGTKTDTTNTNVSALAGRVSTNETDITALETKTDTTNANMSTLAGRVTDSETDIAAIEAGLSGGRSLASGLYKITTNAQGRVTAGTAVVKSDITGLGIPAQDTVTSVSQSGSGNAVTNVTGTNGNVVVTRGMTFVTDDRIRLVDSLPTTPVANVLYLIPE